MTDRSERRTRLSRRALRASVWMAGGAVFASPWVALGLSPRPVEPAKPAQPGQVVIVRKITRRVIVREAPKKRPVHYVYAGGSSSSGSSGGSAPSSGGSSAPPPMTHTGGSGG